MKLEPEIHRRKDDHISLCLQVDVNGKGLLTALINLDLFIKRYQKLISQKLTQTPIS